ncbi:MAG TPA: Crp/Fnr family transcriptional regulator, partial [Dongiaceae bacterium]|nr:Crp/Fnr family transcriptional regulator [Dongiaceae bacterium]
LKKVETFFAGYPKRTYPKDQIIVFANDDPGKVFHILSGKISQYDISYRGDEIVVNIFKEPAFFPMTWAINHTPNPYFYKTDEETVVRVAPPEDVISFIRSNPDVMFNLLSRLYKGIDGVLARTVRLMSGSAKSRVIYELIIECRRFGEKVDDNQYRLKINESDLAAHSGLARETVSREIKHLKERALIELIGGGIVVKNLSALEEQLGKTA